MLFGIPIAMGLVLALLHPLVHWLFILPIAFVVGVLFMLGVAAFQDKFTAALLQEIYREYEKQDERRLARESFEETYKK